jgi:hypothetical protein
MTPLTRGHAGDGDEGEQSLAEHGGCGGWKWMSVCVCVWGGGVATVVRGVSAV